ncbi:MAG TPA: energy transducer TonB [Polyangia bacterium]|nr:energy transducer TonB [Polyangia bacterium]
MRVPTLVLSVAFHVGLAAGLVAFAQQRELRKHRAISVAVENAKKKEAKPKPPPPPRPIARPAPAHVETVAKAAPAAVAHAAAAPVATNLAMSNSDSDVGPGIGLHAPAPKTAAAAPVKVASAISEKRLHHAEEAAGDAPCAEEPTKPEPVVKTEINYALYPQAQADGVEGKIKIRFTIGVDGEVEKVDVVAGIEPGLDAAIVAAAQRWRFKPAMACGKPVAGGTYVLQARFELGN